jgi:RNA polymerase sigma factor (sigma-70 family)
MTTMSSEVFADLFTDAGWARRLAARLVRSEDADDLLQEAWIASRSVPDGVAGRRWLAGVMRNLARYRARTRWRRLHRERAAGEAVQGQAGRSTPEALVERMEAQRLLAELVLALPSAQRDLVLLRFYQELSSSQIARRLGIPAGTVRSRLSVAVAQLRREVESRSAAGAGGSQPGRDLRRGLALLAGGGAPFIRPATVLTVAAAVAGAVLAWNVGAAWPAKPLSVSPRPRPAPVLWATAVPRLQSPPEPAPPGERPSERRPAAAPLAPEERARLLARAQSAPRYQVPLGAGPIRGPADAKVTILEFVDYQCPFTVRAEPRLAALLGRYASDVRFQVIHRPMPFHSDAPLLARAALAAAEQGRFWPLHQRLLEAGIGRWTPQRLDRLAQDAGLDTLRFRRDLDGEAVRARLEVDEATGVSLGLEATPTLFINGRPVGGAIDFAQLAGIVEEELARSEALLAGGVDPGGIYNAAIASGLPVLLQNREDKAVPVPPSEAPAEPRPGFETLFRDGRSCGSPLEEPALDFDRSKRNPPGKDGRIAITAWSLVGGGLEHYRQPARTCRDGSRNLHHLQSTTAGPQDFLAQQQAVFASRYEGKRVELSAEVRAEKVNTFAGIWMRAIDAGGKVIASARTPIPQPAPGVATTWQRESVALTVPARASVLSYGLVLAGRGAASMRSLQLTVTPR